MKTDMITKPWKIQCFTQRVLSISADKVIPLYQVSILTNDNELVASINVDHLETLDAAIRSQIELGLAQHFVDLHNASLKKPPWTKNETSVISVVPPPKKKGGWPKGKPRKPRSAASAQKDQGKENLSAGGSTPASPAPANQGGNVQENIQTNYVAPSGEGWFRP
jgi:hypothetical protein